LERKLKEEGKKPVNPQTKHGDSSVQFNIE